MRSHGRETELAADSAVHVIALAAGAVGALAMMARTTVSGSLTLCVVAAVYSLALVAMLAASAAHNRAQARAGNGKELRRRLDHAAIFVMIAGTYTPLTIRLLSGGLAIGLTAGVWGASLAGAVIKLRYPRRFERLSILIYLVLGWQGLFFAPSLFASLPEPAAALIVTGGVLYSVGAGFHIWTTLPFHNAIWHGFVAIAAGCHYAAIWQAVVLAGTGP